MRGLPEANPAPEAAAPGAGLAGSAPAPPDASARHARAAWAAGLAVAIVATAALYWPLPLHLETHRALSAFGDGHVWAFDHMARMLAGERPLAASTFHAGYPTPSPSPFLGWAPALLAAPLRGLLGPLGAYNVVLLATLPLTYAAAHLFLGRVVGGRPVLVAVGALAYTFSPFSLATLANGQIEKAQLWVYPLYLWVLLGAARGPRRWPYLVATPLVAVAAVYTDPYFGLILPLVATPLAFGWAWRAGEARGQAPPEARHPARSGRARALVAVLVALGLTAGAFASAWPYYAVSLRAVGRQVFAPARAPAQQGARIDGEQSPVAQPRDTLLGVRRVETDPTRSNHTTYLVLPVLLVGVAGLALGGRARWTAAWLVGSGLVVAAGPQLVVDDVYQVWRGHPYYLPVKLVVATGYPIAKGAQYYRAVAVASLGLAVLVIAALGRLRAPRGEAAGVLLVAVALLDGVRASGPRWPRPVEEVVEIPQARAMGLDPGPGAVLSLPLCGSPADAGKLLLLAAWHGRPTQTLAQFLTPQEARMQHPWLSAWEAAAASGGDRPPRALRDLGFRYVLLEAGADDEDAGFRLSAADLAALLGPPTQDGPARVWDLGPTPLRTDP